MSPSENAVVTFSSSSGINKFHRLTDELCFEQMTLLFFMCGRNNKWYY